MIRCVDRNDGQSWYLLGRCYMAQQNYKKAYDCYQQAVYKDGRNPTFWCSIGVLYYQTNQVGYQRARSRERERESRNEY